MRLPALAQQVAHCSGGQVISKESRTMQARLRPAALSPDPELGMFAQGA